VVLEALRETADALTSMRSVDEQLRETMLALVSAESAYELALQRYRVGMSSYLTVLSAETKVLAQRQAHNDLKARVLDAQVLLAHALGGGYTMNREIAQ